MSILELNSLNISYEAILLALVACIACYFILSRTVYFLSKRLSKAAKKTTSRFDDVFVEVFMHTNKAIILFISVLIVLSLSDLPAKWEARLAHGWVMAIGIQVALWFNRGISLWMKSYTDQAMTTTLVFMMRVVVWLTILLVILANLGVNITALVTSLGIGGIAVALALQSILSDLFASISIALDKPFEIGDFIIIDDILGTVEHIGIKSTRIRSLSGEQIVKSNTELLKCTIRNFKRMMERRVVFTFGLTYQTTAEQARVIPEKVRNIIQNMSKTRVDRVHFKQFGNSSLDFEVVYYVLDSDYNCYMNIQQAINVGLMEVCAELGVDFAFPTRTLYLVSDEIPSAKIESTQKNT